MFDVIPSLAHNRTCSFGHDSNLWQRDFDWWTGGSTGRYQIFTIGMQRYAVDDGAVVMSSANGLVGTGFASRYRFQPKAGF